MLALLADPWLGRLLELSVLFVGDRNTPGVSPEVTGLTKDPGLIGSTSPPSRSRHTIGRCRFDGRRKVNRRCESLGPDRTSQT